MTSLNFTSFLEKYDLIGFSFNGIEFENDKKKLSGMPNWKNINKTNYKNFIKSNHSGFAILTGNINNITGIDIDDRKVYDEWLVEYPDLSDHFTVETNKGVHIYFEYCETLKTTTNIIKSVDIRNDSAILISPPTKYLKNDSTVEYKLLCGNAFKPIPDYIINKFNIPKPTIPIENKVIVDTLINKEISRGDDENATKIRELLKLIKIDRKDRETWMRICSCVKYNDLDENDWLDFCNKNKLNMDEEKSKIFKSLKPYPIKIYYLQSLAKESNPTGYIEWLEKYGIYYIGIGDLEDTYKTATIISSTLKNTLIRCKELWFMITDNNLWKNQKEPSFYIISELRKYLDESNKKVVYKISKAYGEEKEKLIELSKKYLNAYKSISNSSYINVLTKFLKTLLVDDDFNDKLDSNSGKMAFKNGIMDLETKHFREGIYSSDFITKTIPYNYEPADKTKTEFLRGVLLKILNNNEEQLEYFLSLIGYTFIGSPNLEKSIYFCIDLTDSAKGDNGKTFFFEILTTLLPNYVYKSKGTLLEQENKKVHKQLAMMKGMRLVWVDELSKKHLNNEIMKELGDGMKTENEVMYGTSELLNILFKLFVLSNNKPSISAEEVAVYNRYKQISYGSHFDRTGERTEEDPANLLFIADTTLGDKIKEEYFNEVFYLIIEYANKYYERRLPPIPEQFKNDTKETQLNNDKFSLWFYENCEVDVKYKTALKEIVNNCRFDEPNVKKGLIRLGYKYNKDLCGIGKDNNGKFYKGGYVGFRMNKEEVVIDEPINYVIDEI